MKKGLLILLSLTLLFSTCKEEDDTHTTTGDNNENSLLTYVPDDNFENYLEAYGIGNGIANDDSVFTHNIDTLTFLYITNQNISDLKGIEDFTGLNGLECGYNQLTNLDLSQNTALTSLNCSYNQLISLNLSNNSVLTHLDCWQNELTSLDLRNRNNTALDIYTQSNPNLFCIDVDDPVWSATNWTGIDPSSSFSYNCSAPQTYVPDDNFEAYLEANGMGNGIANDDSVLTHNIDTLTYLYINSQNISDLTGIEDFTALTFLSCAANQLHSLNVSQNTALESLYCYKNQLTSLDVRTNFDLIDLYCYLNQLTSLDVSQNTALTELECWYNQLSSLDLKTNTALTTLMCGGNQLTSLNVSNNASLINLHCSTNQLTTLDVSHNTVLTSFHCYNNSLTSLDVRNGNNTNFTVFHSYDNSNLGCINVDAPVWSTANWTYGNGSVDPWASFNINCSAK